MGKAIYFIKTLWRVFSLITMLAVIGCTQKPDQDYSYLKGKPISLIEHSFERRADNLEEWSDYKRYTWLVCHTSNKKITETLMVDDGMDYRVKYQVDCCNVVFKTDSRNIIVGYSNLNSCPVNFNFKPKK